MKTERSIDRQTRFRTDAVLFFEDLFLNLLRGDRSAVSTGTVMPGRTAHSGQPCTLSTGSSIFWPCHQDRTGCHACWVLRSIITFEDKIPLHSTSVLNFFWRNTEQRGRGGDDREPTIQSAPSMMLRFQTWTVRGRARRSHVLCTLHASPVMRCSVHAHSSAAHCWAPRSCRLGEASPK